MTRVKLDTPAFADQSVDTRTIKDGTIIAQDVSGSITNAKLANSSITIDGTSVSLGGSATFNPLVEWQAVTVADGSTTLSAVAGRGYFLDTNTGVIEVFLPTSPSRGDTIILVDYSGTFATNKLIINTGGKLIDSTQGPEFKVETNNSIVELVYIDANKGWQVILNQAAGTTPDNALDTGGGYDTITFIGATGGTVTTSGNFKIHTFTGDGNFVVSSLGNSSGGPNNVSYLVVAGGGGGGAIAGGGGGGGGFREGKDSADSYSVSPLVAPAGLPVSVQTYPVTVGAGGTGTGGPTSSATPGGDGSNSIFSTITSTGGGGGGSQSNGRNGGSSGGGGHPATCEGSGNTPPTSPPQGRNGGGGNPVSGGGGGGATGTGAGGNPGTGSPYSGGGTGGAGAGTAINTSVGAPGPCGSLKYFSGGGGGGSTADSLSNATGAGGVGGGQIGGNGQGWPGPSGNGTANTGGAAGGGGSTPGVNNQAAAGGKGIVVIRYKFQ